MTDCSKRHLLTPSGALRLRQMYNRWVLACTHPHDKRALRCRTCADAFRRASPRQCSAEGCTRKHSRDGYCELHSQRMKRLGRLDLIPAEERFWAKVQRGHSEECWLWIGWKTAAGYGGFHWQGRDQYAHRVAYALSIGPIPDGLVLDHLCRTPACVNPRHLEPVRTRTNVIRGVGPTARFSARSTCSRGHEYTGENTRWYRGYRMCLACNRENMRKRAHRSAAAHSV